MVARACATCAVLILLLLGGCSSFCGKATPYVRGGARFPEPHNAKFKAGGGAMWESGARVEATWNPRIRIEEPSSRGLQEWYGDFAVDAIVPIG